MKMSLIDGRERYIPWPALFDLHGCHSGVYVYCECVAEIRNLLGLSLAVRVPETPPFTPSLGYLVIGVASIARGLAPEFQGYTGIVMTHLVAAPCTKLVSFQPPVGVLAFLAYFTLRCHLQFLAPLDVAYRYILCHQSSTNIHEFW